MAGRDKATDPNRPVAFYIALDITCVADRTHAREHQSAFDGLVQE